MRSANRRAPPPVTVRSTAFNSEPLRSPDRGAHQFEIGAGGRINEQACTILFTLRCFQRRAGGKLGLFDIGDRGGGGGKFGARIGAEGFQRGNGVKPLDAGFGAGRVKTG